MIDGTSDDVPLEGKLRYGHLFKAHPVPMWVYDLETLAFLGVNDAAIRTYGYSQDEFLAMTIGDIRPAEDVPAMLDSIRNPNNPQANAGVWRHRLKDGRIIYVEITSYAFNYAGRSAKLVMAADVSERRRLEQLKVEQMAVLEMVATGASRGDVLAAIVRMVESQYPDSLCCVLLLDEDGRTLRHGAAPNLPAEFVHSVDGAEIGPEAGSCGTAAFERRTVIAADIASDPLWRSWRELALKHGLRACWSTPVVTSVNEVLGTLAVYARTARHPSSGEIDLVATCSHIAGIALERHRAEARLRASQTALANAQRIAKLGSWQFDLRSRHLAWSEEIFRIFGVSAAEFPNTGEAFTEFVHPDDRARMLEERERVLAGNGRMDIEHRIVLPSGEVRHVHEQAELICDETTGAPALLAGTVHDITDRKRTEERLRESEALLRIAGRTARMGGWMLEIVGPKMTWSDEVCEIYGVPHGTVPTVEEAVGYYAPESRDQFGRAAYACLNEGRPFDEELQIITAQGRRLWVRTIGQAVRDETGRITRIQGAFQDISERMRSLETVRESEERFKIVARATVDTIWDWDLVADTIWWSEALEATFGHKLDRIAPDSSSWTNHLHPDDRNRVLEGIDELFESRRGEWSDEYRFRKADGSYAHVVDRGFVIRDANGKAVRMVGGMADVTERRAMQAKLQQTQRMEAIGQLTGGVAHDFNNLLTVILGNADALAGKLEDPALKTLADMTRAAADRGAELINRLLAFARQQPLEPRAVDIAELLAGMDGLLRRTLGGEIEIELVRGGELAPAVVDPFQLESALLNLCINSRDAMPGGGRLTIETANVTLDPSQTGEKGEFAAGDYVMIAISDTGTGMDPEISAKAFEPFFTTKEPGKGSGLGLSMVYGFAKQSGGHVKIYSERGHGTTVKLHLPRAAVAQPVAPRAVRDADPGGGCERILLVEDDDLVRQHVTAQLQSLGYEIVAARDGPDALVALGQPTRFDLLFTDVVMPGGLNGPQLAAEAKKLWPDLPVLFTSGYTENAIVHQGRLDRGVHLLTKPYRRKDLAEKVRQVLDRDGKAEPA